MHESAQVPQTRRALRELERSRVPRRRRVLADDTRAIARHVSVAAAQPSPRVSAARRPVAAVAREKTIAAPLPSASKRRSRRVLSLAAFFFAVGLAVTSVVPMLALGQTATAAAAAAVSVQSPGHVQAWKLAMSSTLPAATREAYAAQLARPSAIFNGAAHDDTFVNNINWAIQWPFPFGVPIASPYGPRVAPTEGASTFHKGIDFDPGAGTPIQIITTGVVEKVVTNPGDSLGVHVVVDHGTIDGHHVESLYCEMAPGSVRVTEGQKVGVGDIVGLVGLSGISTGAHLHFEIHVDGQAVDPAIWLRAHAG